MRRKQKHTWIKRKKEINREDLAFVSFSWSLMTLTAAPFELHLVAIIRKLGARG